MKHTLFTCFLAALVPMLTSCASHPVMVSAVGPAPISGGVGHLQVFSPVKEHEDSDRHVFFRQHVGFSVTTLEGKQVTKVENMAFTSQEDTLQLIPLPPGQYLVHPSQSKLTVPIVIKPGRTTVVHLDGSWKPPTGAPEKNLVRLPGGDAVGWRDETGGDSPNR